MVVAEPIVMLSHLSSQRSQVQYCVTNNKHRAFDTPPSASRTATLSVPLRQWRGLDADAFAVIYRHRPAERTAQPLCLHHPKSDVVLLDGHAAVVEAEQQADAVTLVPRTWSLGVHALHLANRLPHAVGVPVDGHCPLARRPV